MRAACQDLLAARLMGIDVNRVIAFAFAIASFLLQKDCVSTT
jgi:branched-subunit amino acid ABC-type transport system permease component